MPALPTTTFHSHAYWCQRHERDDVYLAYAIRVADELGDNPTFADADRIFEEVKTYTRREMMTVLIKHKREEIQRIGEIAKVCQPGALAALEPFEASLTMAAAMARLEELITPAMMSDLMKLANSKLGFMTDRKPGQKDRNGKEVEPYAPVTIKRCFIEATLRGARSIGNEWNIIAGQSYLTREYFERTQKEFPGLTHLKIEPGVAKNSGDGVIIHYKVSWKLNGKADSLERDVPIRRNDGMGIDALYGKGERKIRAVLMRQLTGTTWDDVDDSASGTAAELPDNVIETTATVVSQDELADRMLEPAADKKPDVPPEAAEPLNVATDDVDEKPGPAVDSETTLDAVLAAFDAAETHEELKAIYDRAALAAQAEKEGNSPLTDNWRKVTEAKRKRAAKIGK